MVGGSVGESLGDNSENLEDFSEELNGAIMKCCDEYLPVWLNELPATGVVVKGINAVKWADGVHSEWDFVADMWWEDRSDDNYDSYIPDSIQEKVPTRRDDYFVVNGHKMNREQFNNYVKGATAQFAFPGSLTSTVVNILGIGKSVFDNIEDDLKVRGPI